MPASTEDTQWSCEMLIFSVSTFKIQYNKSLVTWVRLVQSQARTVANIDPPHRRSRPSQSCMYTLPTRRKIIIIVSLSCSFISMKIDSEKMEPR